MDSVLAWRFLPMNRRLAIDQAVVKAGDIYSGTEGIDACERAIDAIDYAPGPMLCRVRVSGDITRNRRKVVGRLFDVLWIADARWELRAFALWCGEWVLRNQQAADRKTDRRRITTAVINATVAPHASVADETATVVLIAIGLVGAHDGTQKIVKDVFNAELERRFLALGPPQ